MLIEMKDPHSDILRCETCRSFLRVVLVEQG